jgi:hypothetical protein
MSIPRSVVLQPATTVAMRLSDMVGRRLTGVHWSDEGLTVCCVKEDLDAGESIVGGAFVITFIDKAWMSACWRKDSASERRPRALGESRAR